MMAHKNHMRPGWPGEMVRFIGCHIGINSSLSRRTRRSDPLFYGPCLDFGNVFLNCSFTALPAAIMCGWAMFGFV